MKKLIMTTFGQTKVGVFRFYSLALVLYPTKQKCMGLVWITTFFKISFVFCGSKEVSSLTEILIGSHL